MTIHLSSHVEEQLRRLAKARGCDVDALAQEAVEEFLAASAITDVSAEQIAQSQARLASELPAWRDDDHASR